MSQTQGTYHERLLRLSLVWRRRAAEDPGRGSPLLLRYMPTPLARDLPQARGVGPERLAKFRARFLERGSRLGTEDPTPEAAGLPMTNATSTTPRAASRVTKSAHMDDFDDPKSTEDAARAPRRCQLLLSAGPGMGGYCTGHSRVLPRESTAASSRGDSVSPAARGAPGRFGRRTQHPDTRDAGVRPLPPRHPKATRRPSPARTR